MIHKQYNVQSGRDWTGETISGAAQMLSDGMKEEAYRNAWGVYQVVYETKGYCFRTPEAYDITGNFRASMYMRPAGIWAMEMTGSSGAVPISEKPAPGNEKHADTEPSASNSP